MAHFFHKHYTRQEAQALLPEVRKWLEALRTRNHECQKLERRLKGLMLPGRELGGPLVNNWARALVELQLLQREFSQREIHIKDLDRGLLDFPAMIGGKEVFLCWEEGEDEIEFWHDLNAGYAGRERL